MSYKLVLKYKSENENIFAARELLKIPSKYVKKVCRDNFVSEVKFSEYFVDRLKEQNIILSRYMAIVKVEYGWFIGFKEYHSLLNYLNTCAKENMDMYFTYEEN